MCGPLAIPLALMAAGSVAKFMGEKQAAHAQNRAYQTEKHRQDDMTAKQTGFFQDSLDRSKAITDPAAQTKAADAREGTLAGAILPNGGAQGGYLPGSSSAPSVVATAADKGAAESHATSSNLARTLAALGGVNDQMQELNTGVGRNSQQIGQLSSFKAGSAGVLDAEMKAAAHKGTFLRGIGGLAQQIGSAMAGAGGIGGAGGGGFSPASIPGGDLASGGRGLFDFLKTSPFGP